MKKLILLLSTVWVVQVSYSQTDSIPKQQLDTVLLKVSRISSLLQKAPASISVYKRKPEDAAKQNLSLQESIQQIPGIFSQNATNFAQDLRISIRGFGARSSFGIRGIKLIVDGIPETTPDGQGQLDNLNLGIIDRIEVLKGPSSSLYGNASGGVIDITTRSFTSDDDRQTSFKGAIGAFGFQNYQATAVVGDSLASYVFHGNYAQSNGYRDQSGFTQVNTNFKGAFRLRENMSLTAILNYSDSPEAQDPGGLTLEEVAQDRRQARQRNIDFKTEEAVSQFKVGTSFDWQKSKKTTIEAYAFYSNRQFDGKLPFEFGGVVDLNRNYFGQGTSWQYATSSNRLQIGYDFGYQNDGRERFRNLEGEIGDQTLNQNEKFTNLGIYVLDHYQIGAWYFTGGIRFDYNKLAAQDNFLSNGDDSGTITLNAVNPSFGVSYTFSETTNNSNSHTLFANFSTSFETPSLSELSADPNGGQGFNEELEPQKATNYEVGIKGKIGLLQYNLVGFYINTKDDLVPFELEAFPDRDFFRNAGETLRRGVEVETALKVLDAKDTKINMTVSYAFSNFTYANFQTGETNLEGKFLPGIPKHKTTMGLQYVHRSNFHASVSANLVGAQFANDSNATQVAGYELLNVRTGYTFNLRNAQVQPYLGINNLLDEKYTDNVRINAFGGRFFEPAPGFNAYGGFIIQL